MLIASLHMNRRAFLYQQLLIDQREIKLYVCLSLNQGCEAG